MMMSVCFVLSVCNRSGLTGEGLRAAAQKELGAGDDSLFVQALPEHLGAAAMDTGDKEKEAASSCVEVETFFHLLTVMRLLDDGKREEAASSASALVEKVKSFVRPTLTPVAAKAFFYLSRAYELIGGERYAAVRTVLLNAHITAGLQHANEAQVKCFFFFFFSLLLFVIKKKKKKKKKIS